MKPCPFCFGDGRIQRMHGAAGVPMLAIACTNDKCLAVGPLAGTEVEAHKKWDARNMNIARPKSKTAVGIDVRIFAAASKPESVALPMGPGRLS